jgi:hypothetical protein
VQRLEVLVAVMLARERRLLATADTAADGCTELAAALATLPSGLLEMVANAVAALVFADADFRKHHRYCSSLPLSLV